MWKAKFCKMICLIYLVMFRIALCIDEKKFWLNYACSDNTETKLSLCVWSKTIKFFEWNVFLSVYKLKKCVKIKLLMNISWREIIVMVNCKTIVLHFCLCLVTIFFLSWQNNKEQTEQDLSFLCSFLFMKKMFCMKACHVWVIIEWTNKLTHLKIYNLKKNSVGVTLWI